MNTDQHAETVAPENAEQAAEQYARSLGVDVAGEPDLFAFVKAMVQMPPPSPWKECKDPRQRVFYWNPSSRRSSWAHPLSTSHCALIAAYRRISCASDRAAAAQSEINARHAQGEAELALWCRAPSKEGGAFYYHAKTKATRWDSPREEMESRLHIEAQLLATLAEVDLDMSPKSGTVDSVVAAVAAAASPSQSSPGATVSVLAAAYEPGELNSHPVLAELRSIFDRCDVCGDGRMSKLALAAVCQRSPEVCDFFRLPCEIRPDDGSRNALEWFFHLLGLGGVPDIDWEDFQAFYAQRLLEIRAYGDTTVEEERLLNDPRWCPNAVLNAGGYAACAGHAAGSYTGRHFEGREQHREADMWSTFWSRVEAAVAAAAVSSASSCTESAFPATEAHHPKSVAEAPADLAVHPPHLPQSLPVARQSAVTQADKRARSAAALVVQRRFRTWRHKRRRQDPEVVTKPLYYKQDYQTPGEPAEGHAPSTGARPGKGPVVSQTSSQRRQPAQTCCLEADDFASTMLVGLFPVRSSPTSPSPSALAAATIATSSQSLQPQHEPKVEDASAQAKLAREDGTSAAEDKVSESASKRVIEDLLVPWQDLMERQTEDLPAVVARDANPRPPITAMPPAPVVDLLADLPQEVLSPVPVDQSKQREVKLASTAVLWPLGLKPQAPQTESLAWAPPSPAVVGDEERNCDMDFDAQTPASPSATSVTASVLCGRRCVSDMEGQISEEIESDPDDDGKVESEVNFALKKGTTPKESIDAFLSSLATATAALDKTWTPHLPRMEQAPHPQAASKVLRIQPLSRPRSPRHQGTSSCATTSKRSQRGPAPGSTVEAGSSRAARIANQEDTYSDDDFEEESTGEEDSRDARCGSPASSAAVGRLVRLTRHNTVAKQQLERVTKESRPIKVHKAYSHNARKAYMRKLELFPHPTLASARHRPAPEPPAQGHSTPALRPVRGKVGVRGSPNSRVGHSAAVPGSLAYSLRQASSASIVKSCPNLLSRPCMR